MAFTSTEMKAIARYCEENNVRPQLSVHPMIRFSNQDGTFHREMNVNNLKAQYKEADKSNGKEKARKR